MKDIDLSLDEWAKVYVEQDGMNDRPITTLDKLKCAQRELALRRSVYPKRVRSGLQTQEEIDRQIALMAAIVDDYTRLVADETEKERLL